MCSHMILHRSMMQEYVSAMREQETETNNYKTYSARAEERETLRRFLVERGLDQRARWLRRPKLRVIDGGAA